MKNQTSFTPSTTGSRSLQSNVPKALSLFIEPTPYITRLDEEIKRQWPATVKSYFIAASMSQKWEGASTCPERHILPQNYQGAIKAIWLEMRTVRPGIVFVAGWRHPVVIAAILMSRVFGAKVISASDTFLSESTGVSHWVKLAVLKLIDRFSPAGKRQARYLRDLGIPARYIFPANMTSDTQAIRNFIRTQGTARRREIRKSLGLADKTPVFLFVGRLEPVKGIDLLLDAFNFLTWENHCCLIIVGDGSMRGMVEQAAEQDPRIIYRGRLEGDDLWAQFASADALVAPSRKEPWGLVVNEALAAGLAVVISDCFGCIDDLVSPYENGLTIPTENCRALHDALLSLIREPAELSRLRTNAAHTTAGWTSEAWAVNVLSAWRDALCSRS